MAEKSADLMVKAIRAIRKSRPLIFYISKGGNDMVKVKAGGIVLGGLAAYLLLSKGINMIGGAVRNICAAREWKNYYKYGKDGDMVPPGYSVHTEKSDGTKEDSNRNGTAAPKQPNQSSAGEALGRAVGDAILKMINDTFGTPKEAEGASEGQTEASESQFDCPRDCLKCTLKPEEDSKCPHASLRPNHGIITQWSSDGKPIAGCYPFSKEKDAEWRIYDAKYKDTEKPTQSTDEDNIVHIPIDSVTVNGKDPGDPDGLNRQDGDTDGDDLDPHVVNIYSDPDIVKMVQEAAEKMNTVIDKPKED